MDLGRLDFSFADLDQGADDAAAHFVKKAFAGEMKCQQFATVFDLALEQRAGGVEQFAFAFRGEGAEVVTADEIRRRFTYGVEIEWARNVPGLLAQQRIHDRVIPHLVTVFFLLGIEAGMKIGIGSRRGNDADRSGELGVESEAELRSRELDAGERQFHMGDKATRVHACIRAAGAYDFWDNAEYLATSFCNRIADTSPRTLPLPTVIESAVEGDGQLVVARGHERILGGIGVVAHAKKLC